MNAPEQPGSSPVARQSQPPRRLASLWRVSFGDAARNHIRTLTEFSASVGYDFRDYLTLTLAYVTLAYHPDFDGARDHVVWNELTTLSLTLSFRLGGFVAERREQREAASEP